MIPPWYPKAALFGIPIWDTNGKSILGRQFLPTLGADMSQMVQIHDQLREMILSLDIGPGERLTERWLETRFQGSRTPVRAALARLEGEGLVQRDGRNWIASPINLGELEA